ncbi:anthocyanidin 3-O-glucosyltransferase 2-like [Pyrus ussuriensis x Pyrus communis]|uniref:Glycosyltransferase n=1 Tax=Pyrus ussuriensis x Pyrus communis TaxID=2448454 RepID=A0A5N5GIH2_9ROSA|nr:anthocyanidin 3-O-glucosyltransferase 2-like [Pyrus ussuriensis x Pyrus communis]
MNRSELVFVPTPAVGHLVSTIEFSKRLLDCCDKFSVTILVMKPPYESSTTLDSNPSTARSLAASHAHIKIIDLPSVNRPFEILQQSVEKYVTVYIENYKCHVRDAIADHVLPNSSVSGLVIDMFCTTMIDVANEFKVPSYLFFTSGAGFLGLLLHLPGRYDRLGTVFKPSDPVSVVPSYVNPVPANVLPSFAYMDTGYSCFANHARRFKETKVIVVNTIFELESHAVGSLLDCETEIPPVYTVGPLIGEHHVQPSDRAKFGKIMTWLDDQPPKSVVFLCFGSFGSFDEAQLREIAVGLEKSGMKFLWSVRKTPPAGQFVMPGEYANHEKFLPQGFLERTKDVGILCGWAPQVEVLAHKAIGGLVSHCGWNSILESMWHGVPVVTWPLSAEQQINAFQMVRDLGLAVELRLDYRRDSGNHFVVADEIEKAVRCVMDGDGAVRKRVEEMSEVCRKAVGDGGSSSTSFRHLIEVMLPSLDKKEE